MPAALVVYESEYGNTKQIAETIRDSIRTALSDADECRLVHVRDMSNDTLTGIDLLVAGCPTQKFSMMPSTKRFATDLPGDALQGVSVAAFDTRITKEEFSKHGRVFAVLPRMFGYAAEPLGKELVRHGGTEVAPPEGFFVDGTEGPILDGELARAKEWGVKLAQSLSISSEETESKTSG